MVFSSLADVSHMSKNWGILSTMGFPDMLGKFSHTQHIKNQCHGAMGYKTARSPTCEFHTFVIPIRSKHFLPVKWHEVYHGFIRHVIICIPVTSQ